MDKKEEKALENKSKMLKKHYQDDNWGYIPKSIRKKCAIWFLK